MANCNLATNITKAKCSYDVAGVAALYLINFDRKNKIGTPTITEKIKEIEIADGEKVYKVEFQKDTASFTDELAEGGNGGKYRTHTVNFSIGELDYEKLNAGDALSLSKFTAVVVDKDGKCFVLGRKNGLSATSFNYESGAADADAKGWTVVMAGSETEIAPILENETLLEPFLLSDKDAKNAIIEQ